MQKNSIYESMLRSHIKKRRSYFPSLFVAFIIAFLNFKLDHVLYYRLGSTRVNYNYRIWLRGSHHKAKNSAYGVNRVGSDFICLCPPDNRNNCNNTNNNMNNMTNARDFLLNVTQRLFSNWTALRMAVEHGMGSKDRAVDFCPYITDIMYMNENLSSDDIAGMLEEYMDTEFQTELQDNSAIEIAEILLKFYRYGRDGDEEIAVIEMNKLAPLQPWILSHNELRQRAPNSRPVYTEYDDNSSDSDDNTMKTDTPEALEWVEVKTRRKKIDK